MKRIDGRYACFLSERRFDYPQLQVAVNGRAYFGCSPRCAEKLKEDPGVRYSVDPVSGRPLDKGLAVIGADRSGRIYFFENEKNLTTFARTLP